MQCICSEHTRAASCLLIHAGTPSVMGNTEETPAKETCLHYISSEKVMQGQSLIPAGLRSTKLLKALMKWRTSAGSSRSHGAHTQSTALTGPPGRLSLMCIIIVYSTDIALIIYTLYLVRYTLPYL